MHLNRLFQLVLKLGSLGNKFDALVTLLPTVFLMLVTVLWHLNQHDAMLNWTRTTLGWVGSKFKSSNGKLFQSRKMNAWREISLIIYEITIKRSTRWVTYECLFVYPEYRMLLNQEWSCRFTNRIKVDNGLQNVAYTFVVMCLPCISCLNIQACILSHGTQSTLQ